MKITTTAAAIREKINDLPKDYFEHVHLLSSGKALVTSFTTPSQQHEVEIRKEGDKLAVSCSCPATTLCKHVVAYYAVAKGIKPVLPIVGELEKKRTQTKGYGLIAESIEKLVDGIVLTVEERLKK